MNTSYHTANAISKYAHKLVYWLKKFIFNQFTSVSENCAVSLVFAIQLLVYS